MKPQLDLFGGCPVQSRKDRHREARAAQIRPAKRPSLDQRYTEFSKANPHVFTELLRLARARLDAGETYISIKALWEELRVELDRTACPGGGGDTYKLNNDHTSRFARALIRAEPRLDGVIRLRGRT